jgi:transcriptional regulator with XRE-family HTH domain
MDLARRVRDLRNIKGLTQVELSERIGLDFAYISRLEQGHVVPSLGLIDRLAKGLEVEVYQFFIDAGAKTEAPEPFPYGSRERTFLRAFHALCDEDKSLLLSMARYLARGDLKTKPDLL